ncbi:unnamed protein product [Rhizophagus irregularis]|uniref:Protein kinase domain-containing protein n=1 Tax=Rhizophagus irregularis TaxID=588596 RepID=A0A915ZPD3_9GLOM|nr:unnamed protein product [Rhizophagus irregularis]
MAIWKDGPLSCPGKWEREAPEKVYLKYLHNSQDITETLSEIKCSMGHSYGISQDPSTKDFILVLQHIKPNTIVALKCLHDTQNSHDDFINEVKAYQNRKLDNILKICWDMNPDNRPTSVEVKELIDLFYVSINQFGYGFKVEEQHLEIRKQFKESVEYREANPLPSKSNQIHTQAIFTSRLLNPFTKNLPKYDDNINNNSVEITDFMNL